MSGESVDNVSRSIKCYRQLKTKFNNAFLKRHKMIWLFHLFKCQFDEICIVTENATSWLYIFFSKYSSWNMLGREFIIRNKIIIVHTI